MNQFQRYLLDESVEDYRARRLSPARLHQEGARYVQAAATDAWTHTRAWFREDRTATG